MIRYPAIPPSSHPISPPHARPNTCSVSCSARASGAAVRRLPSDPGAIRAVGTSRGAAGNKDERWCSAACWVDGFVVKRTLRCGVGVHARAPRPFGGRVPSGVGRAGDRFVWGGEPPHAGRQRALARRRVSCRWSSWCRAGVVIAEQ